MKTRDIESPDKKFIQEIPKAELHLHIEGTLEPEIMFKIAERNHISLRFPNVKAVRKAYNFHNLQSFLDIYYEGARVLVNEQDFYDLTWAYMERAAKQNVRHAEIFFDPQTHTTQGTPFKTVITGIHKALEDTETKLGVSSRLIMCFLRHLSADSAMKTLEGALRYKKLITAVGLDSSEKGNPPKNFVEVFKKARQEGFLTVAHAGEEGPPQYIWEALNLLCVSRIDHGVRCLEDKKLVKRLVKDKIALTVCPFSNVKLRVFKCLKNHNIKKLLKKGLQVTINSDDPAYFGGYVAENLFETAKALKLTREDIYRIELNAFEASFLPQKEKQKYICELSKFNENSIRFGR